MLRNRSDPSAVPGELSQAEQALLKEIDLQQYNESLQCIICQLLIENEKLRQRLAAKQVAIE